MNYSVADFLIQVKNAYMARRRKMEYPYSKLILSIAKILEEEGYIKSVKTEEKEGKKFLDIQLLYKNRQVSLHDVKIISKPSVHIYVEKKRIPKTRGGFGITIVSTSKGVMTDKKAVKENVGGEVLCQLY